MAQGMVGFYWLQANDDPNRGKYDAAKDTMVELSWGVYHDGKLHGTAEISQYSFGPSIPHCIADCLEAALNYSTFLELDADAVRATIKKLREHG
jgi:hypothetical protein